MDDLMQRVYAYNRSIITQERKAKKVEEIRALLQPMGERPGPAELLSFLRKIREMLQEDEGMDSFADPSVSGKGDQM